MKNDRNELIHLSLPFVSEVLGIDEPTCRTILTTRGLFDPAHLLTRDDRLWVQEDAFYDWLDEDWPLIRRVLELPRRFELGPPVPARKPDTTEQRLASTLELLRSGDPLAPEPRLVTCPHCQHDYWKHGHRRVDVCPACHHGLRIAAEEARDATELPDREDWDLWLPETEDADEPEEPNIVELLTWLLEASLPEPPLHN